jgi:hypothetical protein
MLGAVKRIDLDLAAMEIARRIEAWRAAGLTVGAVTWRDRGEPWPYRFKVDQTEVKDADSIGVAVRKGLQEGAVVLFDGGWADFEYWSGLASDEPLLDAPGWEDWLTVEAFGEILDRLAGQFR